jgi:amino acid permease
MSQSISTSKGLFLFSSTIIGAGILALPVVASQVGFLPLAAMIVVYVLGILYTAAKLVGVLE